MTPETENGLRNDKYLVTEEEGEPNCLVQVCVCAHTHKSHDSKCGLQIPWKVRARLEAENRVLLESLDKELLVLTYSSQMTTYLPFSLSGLLSGEREPGRLRT